MRVAVFFTTTFSAASLLFSANPVIWNEDQWKSLVVSTPQPGYPVEARRHWIQGRGLFVLRVEVRTGLVKTVTIEQSTGSQLLDSSAVVALKHWRFKPLALPSHEPDKKESFVRVPVNFVMNRGVRSRMAGAALERPY
jgi:TonB family protein